jgi:hypothetical protein
MFKIIRLRLPILIYAYGYATEYISFKLSIIFYNTLYFIFCQDIVDIEDEVS